MQSGGIVDRQGYPVPCRQGEPLAVEENVDLLGSLILDVLPDQASRIGPLRIGAFQNQRGVGSILR